MFAPVHWRAAAELMRVCKPGGRIGLANWTPVGFLGQLLRLIGEHVPPTPGVQSPLLWGTEAHVRELIALLRSRDLGGGDGLVVPGEYLETLVTK
jgi:hypothetical protein